MGLVIDPHEVYFGSIFDRFNMRFGPAMPDARSVWHSGGIPEIAALQKEFEIFREGRSFLQSAALLGLTGEFGGQAKDRWLEYLLKLPRMQSDADGVNGDDRIVRALVQNLQRATPMPCYMRAYDGRTREPGLVAISEERPLFYLESVAFLTISLPMRPAQQPPARASRSRAPSGPRTPRRRKQAA